MKNLQLTLLCFFTSLFLSIDSAISQNTYSYVSDSCEIPKKEKWLQRNSISLGLLYNRPHIFGDINGLGVMAKMELKKIDIQTSVFFNSKRSSKDLSVKRITEDNVYSIKEHERKKDLLVHFGLGRNGYYMSAIVGKRTHIDTYDYQSIDYEKDPNSGQFLYTDSLGNQVTTARDYMYQNNYMGKRLTEFLQIGISPSYQLWFDLSPAYIAVNFGIDILMNIKYKTSQTDFYQVYNPPRENYFDFNQRISLSAGINLGKLNNK